MPAPADLHAARRSRRPPASTWVASCVAVVVAALLAGAGRVVGAGLARACTDPAGCRAASSWLADAFTAQLVLGALGLGLVLLTAARRARFVRRAALGLVVLSVAVFFTSTLMAARAS